MRIHIFVIASLVGAIFYMGCNGGGGGPAGPAVDPFALRNVSGPCSDLRPIGWGIKVTEVSRGNTKCDTAWTDPENSLGQADSIFVSIGGDSSNSMTIFLEEEVFDGPGSDLVIYEAFTGENDANYDVYMSLDPDTNFTLIASVSVEGTYCIDLCKTGVVSGQYVKIVQSQDVPGFDSAVECDSTWGADIDAIGILNNDVCGSIPEICEHVGEQVDMVCPPDATYRNHGEYVSCVAHAATELLRHFEECFTDEEMEEVHGCIVSQRAKTDIGKKGRTE